LQGPSGRRGGAPVVQRRRFDQRLLQFLLAPSPGLGGRGGGWGGRGCLTSPRRQGRRPRIFIDSEPTSALCRRLDRRSRCRMQVTLIRPPKITTDFAPHTQPGVPPLALACLAAVLEEAGHAVTVIDAYGESPNQAVDIPGTNLNTVGLTADQIGAR